ncbi:MAG: hypothetical protein MNPFHGCM_00146 [Gemmatimonadaceae bacterium]|nr:hypothetical protein [Gemmatimonadaceae bacterium]
MHCSAFRKQHSVYLDDVLSGEQREAMRAHVRSCERCATHDVRIRRAVLLARNIATVEASEDFGRRLAARIRREREPIALLPQSRRVAVWCGAAAASLVLVVGVLASLTTGDAQSEPPRLPAVVASAQAVLDTATAPAIVAAMSAGMVVWPALLIAEEAPLRFASSSQ